ncbi:MAG: transcriptional regulator [Pirellula sp.]|nr:transcriptional regulator [Pirellula sp.]
MKKTLDQKKSEDFAQKMLSVVNHAGLALMTSLGHRSGLFDAMADMPPATSEEIAERTGLNERYVREWLAAMVTGEIVEFDSAARTYQLPAEHAAWVTRKASPNNLAVSTQFVAVLGGVEEHVLAAFRHGRGVPYAAYNRFHEVMAEESAQSVVAGLHDHIVPLIPGMETRLARGIDVLDVGCGSGRAMMHLAEAYPKSRFVGYDFSEEATAGAKREIERRGLKNVCFSQRDLATMSDVEAFDLITAFDAIHDQAKPDTVLRNVRRALRPGGIFLMQDISGSGHLHADCNHPVGPFLYTISCMHCMSVSLAGGGPGLGAMWGKELALKMLGEAGFNNVRVESLEHDPMNFWYVADV